MWGLLLVVNLAQLRRGTSTEDCLHQTNLWAALWVIFSIVNWCKRAKPTEGSTILRQVGLHYIRKVLNIILVASQQAIFFDYLCLSSWLQVPVLSFCLTSWLPEDGLCSESTKWNKSFLPLIGLGQCFYHSSRDQTRTRDSKYYADWRPLRQKEPQRWPLLTIV